MRNRWVVPVLFAGALAGFAVHCSKSSSPTQPSVGPQLTAVPASVTLTVGTSQTVAISGGTPPYSVSSYPSSIATAQLLSADSTVATIQITGVSVASVSTAVTIQDHSPTPVKSVNVPIRVQ